MQLAPNVVRPKSSTVNAIRKPLPSCPSTFSFGTNISVKDIREVTVPLIPHLGIPCFCDFKTGHVGCDQERRDFSIGIFFVGGSGHHREDVSD